MDRSAMRAHIINKFFEKKAGSATKSRVMQNRAQATTVLSFMSDEIAWPLVFYIHDIWLQHIDIRVSDTLTEKYGDRI